MKLTRILVFLWSVIALMSSCTTEDLNPVHKVDNPSILLSLGGSAKKSSTRTSVTAEEGEKTVNNLLAVLFDTNKGFYKTIEAIPVGNEYQITVEDDATYDVYLVANANTHLEERLKNIPTQTPADDPDNGLETIIADQASDSEDQFLMISKYPERVTTSITRTESIGEVHMERLSARFDIVNKADNITVTKITYNNRAIKTSIATRNVMPSDADWFETEKEYIPENGLIGNRENPATYEHSIYSYENYTAKGGEKIPTITIEYIENDQTKTHDVALIDPDATDMTPLAVKRNHLYRIILTKAYKLDFELEILDWDNTEEFNISELPLELDPDIQDELNSRLMVNMFTEYNVKSLDLANKKVEFFSEHSNAYEVTGNTSYWGSGQLRNSGIFAKGVTLTDSENNHYRVPTGGELALLVPYTAALTSEEQKTYITGHWWDVIKNPNDKLTHLSKDFEETIYLENNSDFSMNTSSEARKIQGKSQLEFGRFNQFFSFDFDNGIPDDNKPKSIAPVYGIRFKGTDQYAAYKWEYVGFGNSDGTDPFSLDKCNKTYLSIKIKALPLESDILVSDIVDNHSFWRSGYIEYKFPLSGYYNEADSSKANGTTDIVKARGITGYYISSTYTRPSAYFYVKLNILRSTITTRPNTTAMDMLRLVKVDE